MKDTLIKGVDDDAISYAKEMVLHGGAGTSGLENLMDRYFDEKMDGIVYAVCVSLGFEALENIFHTIHNQRNSCYKWHPIDCVLGILPQNVEIWK